jgi:hypothetical protein
MKKIFTALFIFLACLAKAQTPCDSLDIKISYYPFTDSLLYIEVINNGQTFFSYPQFFAYDSSSDTVAKEQVNLFGIAGSSQHVLNTFPGMPVSDSFAGTLELFYFTVDSYAVCSWNNYNFDLCPDTCQEFYPYLSNWGSAYVLGTANWELLNAAQQVVASGSFTLDSTNQDDRDTVCLLPGNYSLKGTNINLTQGGQKVLGINKGYLPGPMPQEAFNNSTVTVPFSLYEACPAALAVNRTERTKSGLSIYGAEGKAFISNISGEAIGQVNIYSIDGKQIYKASLSNSKASIDLSALPYSMYVVRVSNTRGSYSAKIFCGK